jgi:hypothetical protein
MTTISAALPTSRSSRRTLALLAAVFFLPFLVGTGLFWLDWRPDKFGNHGELLQPPNPLPESGLQNADGHPLQSSQLRGKWLLLMPVEGYCDPRCEIKLQQMLQVHIALNKEKSRVQRILMVSGANNSAGDPANLAQLQKQFPDLVVTTVEGRSATQSWENALDPRGQPIYLVDPRANIMMRYADPIEMRGILKDLERLLKYSWIR